MVRFLLVLEALSFAAAALVHFGVIIPGYEHAKARIAESVIAIILLVGFMAALVNPGKIRTIALVVQGLALFGTIIGLFTIAIGVGPQSLPDIGFHVYIVILLVWGLVLARRQGE